MGSYLVYSLFRFVTRPRPHIFCKKFKFAMHSKMITDDEKRLQRTNSTEVFKANAAMKFIGEEHQEIMNMKVKGTLNSFISTEMPKNGELDTVELCFDHNRVILSEETKSNRAINASYIDGEVPRTYIVTVTPDSEDAIHNFWKMVWEQKSELIVMLNKPNKNEKGKIYWNVEERSTFHCGKINIETLKNQSCFPSFEITKLLVTHEDEGSLLVDQIVYRNWQKIDVLPPKNDLLELMNMTRLYHQYGGSSLILNGRKSPMIVHCSDGLLRSMTFCAIDISIDQIQQVGKANIKSIVSRLREQRFNCLSHLRYYYYCYETFSYYFENLM